MARAERFELSVTGFGIQPNTPTLARPYETLTIRDRIVDLVLGVTPFAGRNSRATPRE